MGLILTDIGKGIMRAMPVYRRLDGQNLRNEKRSMDEIRAVNDAKLVRLVRFCSQNVPYYRDLFREMALSPDHIRTQEDLALLPVINKNNIRQNRNVFLPDTGARYFSVKADTSGTSGIPIQISRDIPSILHEEAYLNHFRRSAGYRFGMRMLVLRGEASDGKLHMAPYVRHIFHSPTILNLSGHGLDEKMISEYFRVIKEFNPEVIYAFPSIAALLARHYRERGKRLQVKIIFTASERLSESNRLLLESVFGARVFDWYGQAERVGAIGQCPYGTYHVMEDYSIMEFLKTPDGLELIGTALHNYVMPLLRYRTNDYFKLSDVDCPCGRQGRKVTQIQGRNLGYVYGKDCQPFSFFAVSDTLDKPHHLYERQFIQKLPGEIIIRYKPDPYFTSDEAERIVREIRHWTAQDMEVCFEPVDAVERMPSGKVRDFFFQPTGNGWNLK